MEMRENIVTNVEKEKVLVAIEEELRPIFKKVTREGDKIIAKNMKNVMFINTNTTVSVLKSNSGYEIIEMGKSSTTLTYWFVFLVLLCTTILWIIPLLILLNNRNKPNVIIKQAFLNVRTRISG